MKKEFIQNFLNKQVEIFLRQDMPSVTGVLLGFDDDFLLFEHEIWSRELILGIRQINAPKVSNKPATQTTEAIVSNKSAKSTPEAIVLPDRRFTGVLTTFQRDEHRRWGFIESPELIEAGIPLKDNGKVFVHINQIMDEILREKLLNGEIEKPDIQVTFRLTQNQRGIAADDVREVENVTLGEVVKLEQTQPQPKTEPDNLDDLYDIDTSELGEIDYFRRYEAVPHGEIRIAGNKLFRFDDVDVIDPALAVFLEVTPNAEGQAVRFVRKMMSNGRFKAIKVQAAVPFPDDKLKEWDSLIKKAEERLRLERS